MTRFIDLNGRKVNVNQIESFLKHNDDILTVIWRDSVNGLNVEHIKPDIGAAFITASELAGERHIVQLVPVPEPVAAMAGDMRLIVLYFALCADGKVRPMGIYQNKLIFLDDLDEYTGLESTGYEPVPYFPYED